MNYVELQPYETLEHFFYRVLEFTDDCVEEINHTQPSVPVYAEYIPSAVSSK